MTSGPIYGSIVDGRPAARHWDGSSQMQITNRPDPLVAGTMTLSGTVTRFEQGKGFIIIGGTIVFPASSSAILPIYLSIGDSVTATIQTLRQRPSTLSDLIGGDLDFAVLVATEEVFGDLPHAHVFAADGSQGFLDSSVATLLPFEPSGQLQYGRADTVYGTLIDPAIWLGCHRPKLSLLDGLVLDLNLQKGDLSDHFDIGDFSGVAGGSAPSTFTVTMRDIELLAQEVSWSSEDFIKGRLVAGAHNLTLMSSTTRVAQLTIDVARTGKGYLEGIKGNGVFGWAAGSNIAVPARIDILWDDVRYATVTAKDHREDLFRKGIVKVGGGFRFQFSSSPGPCGVGVVSAILQESGAFLGHSVALSQNAGTQLTLPTLPPSASFLNTIRSEAKNLPIAIIIPIFNAADDLRRCLASLIRHVTVPAQLILVDDLSTDPAIEQILAPWEGHPNVSVIRNRENLGFSGSINRGIEAAGRRDVILLNSDTIVTGRWLEKMWQAAYSGMNIATVTAVSNNSGAFSVPEIGTNVYSRWLDADSMSRLVQNCSGSLYPEVPTGNGFCMYIRRDCIDVVGLLDAEAFPRGYGEENDFCMRAVRLGFRNIVDDRTFIHHKRSASFGDSKADLYERGHEIVTRRYPEYSRLTSVFSEDPAFLAIRWRVRKALADAEQHLRMPRSRVLYVISTQSGGTPQTNRDLMSELADRYETWLLRCDAKVIELSTIRHGVATVVERHVLRTEIVMSIHRSEEYDQVVTRMLSSYAFHLVHIRHIAWHSLSLPALCAALRIPSVFSFHDFYTVCPTVKLLDETTRFCAGRCTATDGECTAELWPARQIPPLKHRFINEWQARMNNALRPCDAFVTTSPSAADLLKSIFPTVADRGIDIIPHGRNFDEMASLAMTPGLDETLRILMPGNINPAKGSDLCEAVVALPGRREVEFHVLGDAGILQGRPGIVLHGRYKREEFGDKVRKVKPHIGTVLSVWPETYCHTLTEMWAAGIPVVAIDLGAVGERIREHGGGWLLPPDARPEVLNELLRSIRRGRAGYEEKRQAVLRWQSTYGKFFRTNVMADHYDLLYRRIERRRQVFAAPQRGPDVHIVAVVSQFIPDGGSAPASAHIRIGETTRNDPNRPLLFRHYKSAVALEHDLGRPPSVVIVQRDAIDPEDVDGFIALCRQHAIWIVLDCDDDLLSVPEDKDVDGRYLEGRPAFTQLLRNADLVSVSTPSLVATFASYSHNVRLVPNMLSSRLWSKSLSARSKRVVPDKTVALYMGTVTHDADLQLLREPIMRARDQFPNFELRVIGGQRSDEDWFQRIECPAGAKNYPQFVEWFRLQCQEADFALGPLVDTNFNRCKSELKFLDYSASGLTGIYSDVPSYNSIVKNGLNGLLAENDAKSWFDALAWMIEQPASRRRLAAMASSQVRRERIVAVPGGRLQDLIVSLLANAGSQPHSSRPSTSRSDREAVVGVN